jgi:transposase InsO family protein
VRFAFIAAEKAYFPIALMCRLLAVSRAGFYAWRQRPMAPRTRQDQTLAVAVAAIYTDNHGRYGSPRVQMELRGRGQRSGRKRIARLMRLQGLRARPRRRYRTTTDSRHDLPVCPNLLARRFAVAQPNTVWVTDMTYIWTPQGWLYLAVIIDLFSRRVVGWSMSERIDRKLALDALRMALAQRRPPHGLIHHSDRGSQYASEDYQQLLAQHGLRCSMSRRGDCWDNAVAESFFASLKLELVYQVQWPSRAAARTALFEYLELFYNRRRRHSSLGYLSPVEFERRDHLRSAA